ncbi:MAG TPA: TlpA disulfide reductase family protein [Planctomycetaceae bacterium]|nr:TlpA disulfide reductase family protein [Planctomycetaceae bacterium]
MNTRLTLVLALAVVAPFGRSVADEPQNKERFENPPGKAWLVEPFSTQSDGRFPAMDAGHGMVVLAEEGKGGELVVIIARPGAEQEIEGFDSYVSRPIAFDERGKRHDLRPLMAVGSRIPGTDHGVLLERYGSDPEQLPASRITHVGLEGLTTEGAKRVADEAAREARERGIAVLPLPVVGEPYAFDLTDIDGKPISSRQLAGKVVLLDYWATWCAPCMAKMPELKALHERWHDRGFEVVGINLDEDEETCRKAVAKLGVPWRQSMAPVDEDLRKVWEKATGLRGAGRLLLIDRDGVLRADCRASELEKRVAELITDASHETP